MKIKLADRFYRYVDCAGLFEYIVIGIRQYKGGELYELECQACTHGWKCVLLCGLDDRNNLQYIRMLNNDGDRSQSHFHTHSGQFFKNKKEALIDKANRCIESNNDRISKIKQKLKYYEDLNNNQIKFISDLKEKLENNV